MIELKKLVFGRTADLKKLEPYSSNILGDMLKIQNNTRIFLNFDKFFQYS